MGKTQPRTADLDCLNQEISIARCHEKLYAASDGFVWEWAGVSVELDRMLWPIARSAGEFLTAGDLTRLRACGGEGCGWLFEDGSRNRSRHWCTMQDCGNMAKVRRFRSRHREAAKNPAEPLEGGT